MRASTRFQNGFFEHRLIQFKTDFLDVTGLLVTHQIARTANVEVVARQLEARAQAIEVAKHLQALFRCLCQCAIGFVSQIGIRTRL